MNDDSIFDGLREKLSHEIFPTQFLFKFIFPIDKLEEVKSLFETSAPLEFRPSSGGKYLSLTYNANVESVDSIIDIYRMAGNIKGVISL